MSTERQSYLPHQNPISNIDNRIESSLAYFTSINDERGWNLMRIPQTAEKILPKTSEMLNDFQKTLESYQKNGERLEATYLRLIDEDKTFGTIPEKQDEYEALRKNTVDLVISPYISNLKKAISQTESELRAPLNPDIKTNALKGVWTLARAVTFELSHPDEIKEFGNPFLKQAVLLAAGHTNIKIKSFHEKNVIFAHLPIVSQHGRALGCITENDTSISTLHGWSAQCDFTKALGQPEKADKENQAPQSIKDSTKYPFDRLKDNVESVKQASPRGRRIRYGNYAQPNEFDKAKALAQFYKNPSTI